MAQQPLLRLRLHIVEASPSHSVRLLWTTKYLTKDYILYAVSYVLASNNGNQKMLVNIAGLMPV
jgi:hypothetical protein